jgi:hypothetical protein
MACTWRRNRGLASVSYFLKFIGRNLGFRHPLIVENISVSNYVSCAVRSRDLTAIRINLNTHAIQRMTFFALGRTGGKLKHNTVINLKVRARP